MKTFLTITLIILSQIAISQVKKDLRFDFTCQEPISKNTILYESADTFAMAHSNCIGVHFYNSQHNLVLRSTICDTNYKYHGAFDNIGNRWDNYYDSSDRIFFSIKSHRGKTVECFNYHYANSSKVAYKEGFISGKAIRISYEYDDYGNVKKETTQTLKETVVKTY